MDEVGLGAFGDVRLQRLVVEGGLLSQHCARLPEQDRASLDVPPRGGRRARKALVGLRFGHVTLTRPAAASRDLPPNVALWVVVVNEIDPPPASSRCIGGC